jgi:hypothetical protein
MWKIFLDNQSRCISYSTVCTVNPKYIRKPFKAFETNMIKCRHILAFFTCMAPFRKGRENIKESNPSQGGIMGG